VSQCEAGTLFEELLQSEEMAKAQTGPTHTESDLVKHVDNYLKAVGLPLSTKEYYEEIERERVQSTRGDKKERVRVSFIGRRRSTKRSWSLPKRTGYYQPMVW
jgi:hypothetical protein